MKNCILDICNQNTMNLPITNYYYSTNLNKCFLLTYLIQLLCFLFSPDEIFHPTCQQTDPRILFSQKYLIKDTLKAFNDFKNKQKSYEVMFSDM